MSSTMYGAGVRWLVLAGAAVDDPDHVGDRGARGGGAELVAPSAAGSGFSCCQPHAIICIVVGPHQ